LGGDPGKGDNGQGGPPDSQKYGQNFRGGKSTPLQPKFRDPKRRDKGWGQERKKKQKLFWVSDPQPMVLNRKISQVGLAGTRESLSKRKGRTPKRLVGGTEGTPSWSVFEGGEGQGGWEGKKGKTPSFRWGVGTGKSTGKEEQKVVHRNSSGKINSRKGCEVPNVKGGTPPKLPTPVPKKPQGPF